MYRTWVRIDLSFVAESDFWGLGRSKGIKLRSMISRKCAHEVGRTRSRMRRLARLLYIEIQQSFVEVGRFLIYIIVVCGDRGATRLDDDLSIFANTDMSPSARLSPRRWAKIDFAPCPSLYSYIWAVNYLRNEVTSHLKGVVPMCNVYV